MIRPRILLTGFLAVAALAAVPASASVDFGFLGDLGTTGDQNQLEDYGPQLLIKPRKKGQIKVWATVGGVRSLNTVTLRAV